MMSFNDFVHKYKLKTKAKSNIKKQQVLSSLGLSDVGISSRDGPFSSDIGIVNLYLSKGTQWVGYINETYSDSYDCAPPNKLSKFIIKQNGHYLYSQYKIQSLTTERDSYCASYYLYII